MKTNILIIFVFMFTLIACEKVGSSSKASIDPATEGLWERHYTESGTSIREVVSIIGRAAVIQMRDASNSALIQEFTWIMTAIDADTVSVNDGTEVFNADYSVDGNTLEVCPEASACMVFTKIP